MNGKQEYYHLFMADVSRPTLIDWYNFCRDVCLEILLADNRKIGGQGHIVEIDESQSRKNKYHKGRLVDGVGVFRGIDRTTRETFFKTVEDWSAETLLPIILENVHPDMTIISDCRKAYSRLQEHFFRYRTINHSVNFVDPEDPSLHANTIETMWCALLRNMLPGNGTQKDFYMSYFDWYCIQRWYIDDSERRFKAFLELVRRIYPLKTCENAPPASLHPPVGGKSSRSSLSVSLRPKKRQHAVAQEQELAVAQEFISNSDFE